MHYLTGLGLTRAAYEGVGTLKTQDGRDFPIVFALGLPVSGGVYVAVQGHGLTMAAGRASLVGATFDSPEYRIEIPEMHSLRSSEVWGNSFPRGQYLFKCRSAELSTSRGRIESAILPASTAIYRFTLTNYFGADCELSPNVRVSMLGDADVGEMRNIYVMSGGIFPTAILTIDRAASPGEAEHIAKIASWSLSLDSGTNVVAGECTVISQNGTEMAKNFRYWRARQFTYLPESIYGEFDVPTVFNTIVNAPRDEQASMMELIEHFLECCNSESFIQAQSINACALIDTMTKVDEDESEDDGTRTIQDHWKRTILDMKKSGSIPLSLFDKASSHISNFSGRPGFKKRVSIALEDRAICASDHDRSYVASQVREIRNSLTHDGSFASRVELSHEDQFHLIVWTAAALLSRRLGQTNGFMYPPEPEANPPNANA